MTNTMDPTLFIRSISEAQAKIVLSLLFKRGGMTIEELERRTGIGRKALYRACGDLANEPYNMLVKQTGAHGKAFWAPSSALLPSIAGNYFAIPDVSRSPICLEVPSDEVTQMGLEAPSEQLNTTKIIPGGVSGPTCAGSIMMIDDESLTKDIDSSSIMNPPNKKLPGMQLLLDGLEILFGDTLDFSDLPYGTNSQQLLAWIVKAYSDRKRLSSPLGMIISRLKKHSPRSLPKDWQDRLPNEYLVAIGVPQRSPEEISDRQDPNKPDELDERDELDEEDLSLDNPKIVRAWETVLGQLQTEMPRASYDTWVRDTFPTIWDAEGSLLTIYAHNQYAADWLENRLTSTVQRLLAGILNQAVTVKFTKELP
jgi:hypothetical protein